MFRIRQELRGEVLADPGAAIEEGLERAGLRDLIPTGSRVAVAVGSRNIDRLPEVVSRLVAELCSAGCVPFVIPSMGSHGGATGEEQETVLAGLGITKESVGAPIEPSMETVPLGTTAGGVEAFVARAALESDAIVVVNRVGPHTGYSGPVQSGLMKMLAVGLGKAPGARALHSRGFGAAHLIREIAGLVIEKAPVSLGVALLENGRRRLSKLAVVGADEILVKEPVLLEEACAMQPGIPIGEADVLIVDEMGKDVSGIGMDPLVTGRGKELSTGAPTRFSARRLVVLGLTTGTRGNATGVGHADITTKRLVGGVDWEVTYRNVLTSGALERARIPLIAETDAVAVEMALESIGDIQGEDARVVRIRNTGELGEMWVSAACEPEVLAAGGIEILSGAREMEFDPGGKIV